MAAAEAVARMKGRWGSPDACTEPLDKWVDATKIQPEDALVQKAIAVVARVLSPLSELLELWTESDGFDAWTAAVADLRSRLAGS